MNPTSLNDREVRYVVLACLIGALCLVGVMILFGGCSQPAAVPTLLPCAVKPAVVSDTFCAEEYAGTSRCVACYKTAAFFDRDPVYGCVLPNNQYCIDASGCGDSRCAKPPWEKKLVRDAGAN